jgi:hypothetical protein
MGLCGCDRWDVTEPHRLFGPQAIGERFSGTYLALRQDFDASDLVSPSSDADEKALWHITCSPGRRSPKYEGAFQKTCI